tara:strand:+ start:2759 stop:2869 length:111 start_codon:yes stop_codon:yes gene_type:complete
MIPPIRYNGARPTSKNRHIKVIGARALTNASFHIKC